MRAVPTLEDTYLFRHAAYRDVAYELQLPSERSHLHARALGIMERLFANEPHLVAAELAVHARQAQRETDPELAEALSKAEFRYLLLQIEQEERRAQWDSLVHTTERALECARDDEALLGVWEKRVLALEYLGRRVEAEAGYLTLAELGRRLGVAARVITGLCGAATCMFNLGRHDEAERTFAEAEAAAGDDRALQAKLYMDRALFANARGDFEENERHLLNALELSDACDRRFRLGLRGNLANLYGNTGRHDLAIAEFGPLAQEFAAFNDLRGQATAYANLGRQYLLIGDCEGAATNLQLAIQYASEIGNLRSVAFALSNLAEVNLMRGDLDSALASAERARDIASEQGLPLYHAAYECTLALVHLLLGHEKKAAELVEDARAEFIAVHGETFVPEYCNPVRLRIAAWQAISAVVPGRSTSRLQAAPPSPSWLPVMRVLLHEMEESREARGPSAGTQLRKATEAARLLIAEIETAVAENRPALVFRGYLPAELQADARKSMLVRLQKQSPAECATLQKFHPALWQAMNTD